MAGNGPGVHSAHTVRSGDLLAHGDGRRARSGCVYESDITFAGKKRITLTGGGSYLRLEAGKIEYGTTATYLRRVKRTMAVGASTQALDSLKQMKMITQYFDRKLHFSSDINFRVETVEGAVLLSGSGTSGYITKSDSESEYWVFIS
ncbi:TPA: hypothetical protein MIN40_23910 [Klebsiella pneumoniae]|nr:hypothetical protein [Klebsiella pneumoniae]